MNSTTIRPGFLAYMLLACLLPGVLLAQDPTPHSVGLVDMAHVFNNYTKFTALKEKLQSEIEESDLANQEKLAQIKQYQQQLTSGNIAEGSADFKRIETQLLGAQTDLETARRLAQREFLRKEAEVYKSIYLEVQATVKQYAEYYKYTLILRFNSEEVSDLENPREIMNGMNRQVLYHRGQDNITEPILKYLNDQWGSTQTAVSPSDAKNQ